MPKFVLPNDDKSSKVIAGRYMFVDGEMVTSVSDALKLEKILCRFHGCSVVYDSEPVSAGKLSADTSLAVDVTKTGAATPVTKSKQVVEPAADAVVKEAPTSQSKA